MSFLSELVASFQLSIAGGGVISITKASDESAAAALAAASMLVLGAIVVRGKLQTWLRFVTTHPTVAAWSIFAGLLLVSVLLDERLLRLDVHAILEELLEMNAALALILAVACTLVSAGRERRE